MVLIGDAFATSCPAAGTGVGKVFTDVERLCNVHIPAWLATPGMGRKKTDAFYDDPVKQASDAASFAKAHWLRSLSINGGTTWRARRWARFAKSLAASTLRAMGARPGTASAGTCVVATPPVDTRSQTMLAHE
jgi:hypothetical protein